MLEGLGARALAAGLRACGLPPWAELDEGSRQVPSPRPPSLS